MSRKYLWFFGACTPHIGELMVRSEFVQHCDFPYMVANAVIIVPFPFYESSKRKQHNGYRLSMTRPQCPPHGFGCFLIIRRSGDPDAARNPPELYNLEVGNAKIPQ